MKHKSIFLGLVFCLLAAPIVVYAQDLQPKLQVVLIRNFGYGGFGRIQGRFTLKVKDPPEGLQKVTFLFDDKTVHEVDAAPFEYQFHTSDYEEGEHKITVTGKLITGEVLKAAPISKVFLSSEQAWGETQRLIVPLLLFTALLTLIGIGVPLLWSGKKEFVVGRYGAAGGAVCSRCEFPFSRSFFSPNLIIGKLMRCPHCGKINLQARASFNQLTEAENRYLKQDQMMNSLTDEKDFLSQLEDSRFED